MLFWPPKWSPGGARELVVWPVEAVQDGLGIDLVRSFFRLAVWVRFFGPLGLLLGPSWGAPRAVLAHLGLSWGRFGTLRGAFCSLQLLSYLFSCFIFLLSAVFSLPMAL